MENSKQPAYPIVGMAFNEETKGLTKRELIAAMAMQGILANPELCQSMSDASDYLSLASDSLLAADALLSELDKPTNK